jgi:hypothetical protein
MFSKYNYFYIYKFRLIFKISLNFEDTFLMCLEILNFCEIMFR